VQQVLVCNPRRNALLKEGSKSDKVDARKLAELLRTGMLRAVYHGENGLRTLRELVRSYQTISKDLTRVMNRLKALYRGVGVPCTGTQVYAPRYREEWLNKIPQAGLRRRAELLYQQLDGLQALRRNLRASFWPRAGNIKQRNCCARTARLLRPDWHLSQPFACVASGAEWRRAPLLHGTVELGQATGVGIAARTCGGPKQPNH